MLLDLNAIHSDRPPDSTPPSQMSSVSRSYASSCTLIFEEINPYQIVQGDPSTQASCATSPAHRTPQAIGGHVTVVPNRFCFASYPPDDHVYVICFVCGIPYARRLFRWPMFEYTLVRLPVRDWDEARHIVRVSSKWALRRSQVRRVEAL